jgi:gluconolactonase
MSGRKSSALILIALALFCVSANDDLVTLYEPVKVGDGLKAPEGPAYDGLGRVVVSNTGADYVTRFDAQGKAEILWRASSSTFTFQKTNGMTYYRDGSLFVCDFGRKAIIRIYTDGRQELYADQCDGQTFKGPNDLAFDPEGNLYFTDPKGSDEHTPTGCIYRIANGARQVVRVAEGLAFPNGIAFSADAHVLYVAESRTFSIIKFPVSPDGRLGPKSIFARLPTEHDPDGIGLDTAGNLWVAQYGAGVVLQFDPRGNLIRTIRMPGKNITNLEFAGRDLKTLYVTEEDTGTLYKLRVEIAGLPLFNAPPNSAKP